MKKALFLSMLLATLASPPTAFANPVPGHPRVNEVNNRLGSQHSRIAAGETSGQVSASEQRRLNREYAHIKTEEHRMRAADGGHLTRRDQAILNRQLDRRSHEIYRDEHN